MRHQFELMLRRATAALAFVALAMVGMPAIASRAEGCAPGAVKPDGGGADGYFTCVAGAWVHTVPTFNPDSADGYGDQPLPPLCIRHPGPDNPCPTGEPVTHPVPTQRSGDTSGFINFLQSYGEQIASNATRSGAINLGWAICDDYDQGMSNSAVGNELMSGAGGFSAQRAALWTAAAVGYLCPDHRNALGS